MKSRISQQPSERPPALIPLVVGEAQKIQQPKRTMEEAERQRPWGQMGRRPKPQVSRPSFSEPPGSRTSDPFCGLAGHPGYVGWDAPALPPLLVRLLRRRGQPSTGWNCSPHSGSASVGCRKKHVLRSLCSFQCSTGCGGSQGGLPKGRALLFSPDDTTPPLGPNPNPPLNPILPGPKSLCLSTRPHIWEWSHRAPSRL